jgi:hypothetical protein
MKRDSLEKLHVHQKNELHLEKARLMFELHVCPCGGSYSLNGKARHLRTNRHLKYQESQKQTVEIEIEPQIIEKQDEIILIQPEISEKAQVLEKNRIHVY